MPFSPINFLQAQTSDYGSGNLLESALQGYEMSRKPKQIAQEEQQREFANRLLGHQGTNEEIKSRYLPREYEANIGNTEAQTGLYGAQTEDYTIKNAFERQYGGRKREADIHHQELVNKIAEKTGMRTAEADAYLKEQQAKYQHLNHMTPDQKVAADLYGHGTPEYFKYLKETVGDFELPKDDKGENLPLPPNATPMRGMMQSERNEINKRMETQIAAGRAASKADKNLDKIIEIVKNNPNINQSMAYLMTHPDDDKTWNKFMNSATSKGANKKDLDIFRKNTAELVINLSQSGNVRATDFLRRLHERSKPNEHMSPEAILEVAQQMKETNRPLINYAKVATPWLHKADVPYLAEHYESMGKEAKENDYEGTGYSEKEVKDAWQEEKNKRPNVTLKDVIDELKALQ